MDLSTIEQLAADAAITPVQNVAYLRLINQLLPLQNRLYPLVQNYTQSQGLISVPWEQYQLLLPGCWLLPIATWYIFEGRKHVPEFGLMERALQEMAPGTVIDVGGNLGYYLLEVRRVSQAPIISYEPIPLVYAILKRNVEFNQLPQVEVRNRACGSQNGTVLMSMGINSYIPPQENLADGPANSPLPETFDALAQLCSTTWTPMSVPSVTLDTDLQDVAAISLIKIDCEGFEYHVLQGARAILDQHRPLLFIEVHPPLLQQIGHTVQDILEFLRPNYQFEFWSFQDSSGDGRLARFCKRYLPTRGEHFSSEADLLNRLEQGQLPTFHLLAYPL